MSELNGVAMIVAIFALAFFAYVDSLIWVIVAGFFALINAFLYQTDRYFLQEGEKQK